MTHTISLFDFTTSNNAIKTILWSGLIAGILDSIAGVVVYYFYFDLNPMQVLQFIASGIHGASAINGGAMMVLQGLFFHFLIAYVCAIIYFFAYPQIGLIGKHIVPAGLVFGLGVWLVMNLIILPQSNIPKSPFDAGLAVIGIVWHVVLVGLPIAVITSKYYSQNE